MKQPAKTLLISMIACSAFFAVNIAAAAIFVKIPNIPGDSLGPDGATDWFTADSFSFGIDRELKTNSGRGGGTEDINIGVGELQECTISKSMDATSGPLAQFAINGNSLGSADVCFSSSLDATGTPNCYLRYKLDRAFVKSWSTSGDADDRPTEEVLFYYNRIAFAHQSETEDGRVASGVMSWDNLKQKKWDDGLDDIFDLISGTPNSPQ